MITDADKAFMKAARQDMLSGRTFEVVLMPSEIMGYDPDTNEPIPIPQEPKSVQAHVTESAGYGAVNELELNNGIIQKTYDIKCDIAIEDWIECEQLTYEDNLYKVVGAPKKGIGVRNRIEIYGELVH